MKFRKLLKWLEKHGESAEDAREDRAQRATWPSNELGARTAAEVAKRKALEAKEHQHD